MAARVIGASDLRIVATAVIPNCIAPLIVQATLGMGAAILDAAGLSLPRSWRRNRGAGVGRYAQRKIVHSSAGRPGQL